MIAPSFSVNMGLNIFTYDQRVIDKDSLNARILRALPFIDVSTETTTCVGMSYQKTTIHIIRKPTFEVIDLHQLFAECVDKITAKIGYDSQKYRRLRSTIETMFRAKNIDYINLLDYLDDLKDMTEDTPEDTIKAFSLRQTTLTNSMSSSDKILNSEINDKLESKLLEKKTYFLNNYGKFSPTIQAQLRELFKKADAVLWGSNYDISLFSLFLHQIKNLLGEQVITPTVQGKRTEDFQTQSPSKKPRKTKPSRKVTFHPNCDKSETMKFKIAGNIAYELLPLTYHDDVKQLESLTSRDPAYFALIEKLQKILEENVPTELLENDYDKSAKICRLTNLIRYMHKHVSKERELFVYNELDHRLVEHSVKGDPSSQALLNHCVMNTSEPG